MTTSIDVTRNRKLLAADAAKFAAGGAIPDTIKIVSCYRNSDSGIWHATYGSQIPDTWDGSGPAYRHFVGDGATEDEARAAALQDFATRAVGVA